jgi:hypothetical protein
VRLRALFVSLALLLPALAEGSAAAAETDPPEGPRAEPPIMVALVAGMATAIVPLVLGGLHTAAAANAVTDGPRNVGYAVGGVGPALAPIVAHAVLGEWGRAAAFGAVPVASEIAVCALVTAVPDGVFHGTTLSRTGFALLYSADLFGAAVGLVDVMLARDRLRARGRKAAGLSAFTLAPSGGRGHAGLVLGGSL